MPVYRSYYPQLSLESYLDPDTGELRQGWSVSQMQANWQALEPVSQMPTLTGNAGKYPRVAADELGFEFVSGIVNLTKVIDQIGNGGVLSSSNAFLSEQSGLTRTVVTALHSTDPTQPVGLSVDSLANVGDVWFLVQHPDQVGSVTISVPSGWSINGTVDGQATLDGPNAFVLVILLEAGRVLALGGVDAPQVFSGDTEFRNGNLRMIGGSFQGLRRFQRVVGADYTLATTSGNESDIGAIIAASAAVTITVPAAADWVTPGDVIILNTSGGTVTVSGPTNSTSVAAGDALQVVCTGSDLVAIPLASSGVL